MIKFSLPNMALISAASISVLVSIYFFLNHDHCLNSSVSAAMACTKQLDLQVHLLVIGLIPVYLGLIIFGTGLFGLYLFKTIQKNLLNKN